ncbi:MAG: hypothetical protein F6K55_12225 [Moorea sp. SIO4A3]|nr:hypothetical protein [Moorena sp. SIO4A3]
MLGFILQPNLRLLHHFKCVDPLRTPRLGIVTGKMPVPHSRFPIPDSRFPIPFIKL